MFSLQKGLCASSCFCSYLRDLQKKKRRGVEKYGLSPPNHSHRAAFLKQTNLEGQTVSQHGIGDFQKARRVCTDNQITCRAEFL